MREIQFNNACLIEEDFPSFFIYSNNDILHLAKQSQFFESYSCDADPSTSCQNNDIKIDYFIWKN